MSMTTNKSAQTISFDLGEVPCVLKVTWEAVAAIENDLGCGIVPLARRLAAGSFGLNDLVVVILHGLKASGTEGRPSYESVAALVMKAGLLNPDIVQAVSVFCDFALTGGEPPKKDAGPE